MVVIPIPNIHDKKFQFFVGSVKYFGGGAY